MTDCITTTDKKVNNSTDKEVCKSEKMKEIFRHINDDFQLVELTKEQYIKVLEKEIEALSVKPTPFEKSMIGIKKLLIAALTEL